MQVFQDRVATCADLLKRFLSDPQVRDQRKVFLAEEPEVRCGLAMFLRKFAQVIIFWAPR